MRDISNISNYTSKKLIIFNVIYIVEKIKFYDQELMKKVLIN